MSTINNSKNKQDYLLSSVKNALQILKSFTVDNKEKKTSELAKELGLGKSTVSRLLSTLASEGFVTKDSRTNKYKLGFSLLGLNSVILETLELQKEAIPELKKLVDTVEETSHLVMLDGMEVIYVHRVECNQPVRIHTQIGAKNPVYCTSSGKVILAYRHNSYLDDVIKKGLVKHTNYTITDPHLFKLELKKVKEQGYAICNQEVLEGVCSIAAPIFDYTGEVIAAVNLVGPIQRIHERNIHLYIKQILQTAAAISANLGYEATKQIG